MAGGGTVNDVAWHQDGSTLASASADGVVRLWDTGSETVTRVIARQDSARTAVAIDPTDDRLAHGGDDGVVWIHTLDPTELLATERSRVARSLTDEECLEYLGTDCQHG